MWSTAQSHKGKVEFPAKQEQVLTGNVGQLHPLQIVPGPFRIQIRSIGRQLLEMYVIGSSIRNVGSHLFSVYRRAVPGDQQFALELLPQMAQKPDAVAAVESLSVIRYQSVEPSTPRDPAPDR